MKLSKLTSVLAITLAFGTSSLAQAAHTGSMWEIWTGSLADVTFYSTGAPNTSSSTAINVLNGVGGINDRTISFVKPSIGYNLGMHNIQIKFSPSYQMTSVPATATTKTTAGQWRALLGVNWSFLGTGTMDSFFVEAQAGLNHISNGIEGTGAVSNTKFAWAAGVGKRFALTESIAFSPQFQIMSIANDTSTVATAAYSSQMAYSFVPLQFSLIL